jgi:hypothetical protein
LDLLGQINSGCYQFSPQQNIIKQRKDYPHKDVLVMRLIANHSGHRYHSLAGVPITSLSDYQFACKTLHFSLQMHQKKIVIIFK